MQKLLVGLTLLSFISVTLGCDGYKLKVNKIVNCAGDDAVIIINPNTTVKLNKDCEIIPLTCVKTKGFEKATVKYKVFKNNILMTEGSKDICEVAKNAPPEYAAGLSMFGLPSQCPVEPGEICANGENSYNIKQKKGMLAMAMGKIKTKIEIAHDNGKSCQEIEIELKRS